ncbi:MAG: glycosyltransferase [Pyrinomonadaceae bacterium]
MVDSAAAALSLEQVRADVNDWPTPAPTTTITHLAIHSTRLPIHMNDTNPLVSVIALCYNQSRFVRECLESIRTQTYKNLELIILDDCSKDDSVAVIRNWIAEHDVKCVFIAHAENRGICKTLNEALSHASGKYVMAIATDDVCLPDRIESHVRQMEALPEDVGVLYSDALRIDEDGNVLPKKYTEFITILSNPPTGDIFSKLLEQNFIPAPATLIRKACYDKVGLYDERLCYEDWDMWLRISQHYKFVFSPSISAKYRIVPTSATHLFLGTQTREKLVTDIILRSKYLSLRSVGETQKRILKDHIVTAAEAMYEFNYEERNTYLLQALRHDPRLRTLGLFAFSLCAVPYKFFLGFACRFDHLRRKLRRYGRLRFTLQNDADQAQHEK